MDDGACVEDLQGRRAGFAKKRWPLLTAKKYLQLAESLRFARYETDSACSLDVLPPLVVYSQEGFESGIQQS